MCVSPPVESIRSQHIHGALRLSQSRLFRAMGPKIKFGSANAEKMQIRTNSYHVVSGCNIFGRPKNRERDDRLAEAPTSTQLYVTFNKIIISFSCIWHSSMYAHINFVTGYGYNSPHLSVSALSSLQQYAWQKGKRKKKFYSCCVFPHTISPDEIRDAKRLSAVLERQIHTAHVHSFNQWRKLQWSGVLYGN